MAWAYTEPIDGVTDITGHVSFHDTIAHVVAKGEPPAPPGV